MQETTQAARPARWVAPLLLLLGGLFIALAWALLGLYLQQSCGWMAIAAALVSAAMLKLGGMPRGLWRAALALLATLSVIVLVNWVVAATQIGFAMGLDPWDSAWKLGVDYAWTLARLANRTTDLAWMAIALVVAAITAH